MPDAGCGMWTPSWTLKTHYPNTFPLAAKVHAMDELFPTDPISEHNRRAWDARVRQGEAFTKPAEGADFQDPLAAVDAPGWLSGNIRDQGTSLSGGRRGDARHRSTPPQVPA